MRFTRVEEIIDAANLCKNDGKICNEKDFKIGASWADSHPIISEELLEKLIKDIKTGEAKTLSQYSHNPELSKAYDDGSVSALKILLEYLTHKGNDLDCFSKEMKLIYFYANWCGYCKDLNNKFMGDLKNINDVKIYKFNCDDVRGKQYLDKFNVQSIPTLVLIDGDEKILWQHTGSDITKEQLEEIVELSGMIKMTNDLQYRTARMGLISLSGDAFGIHNILVAKFDKICGNDGLKNFINK